MTTARIKARPPRGRIIGTAFALCLGLAGCTDPTAPPASPASNPASSPADITGTARVIDGDSLVVAGVEMRLNGLDAPEVPTAAGQRARAGLARIARGPVSCDLTGERSYDRMIARCANANGDLAAQMVAAGLALDCARYSGGRYARYETAEARATLPRSGYC
ncbi:thermonuclease family protein [Halovulum sp. GXIMD14794]